MEILVNTTTDPVTVTYVYTLTANGCSNTQTVSVVVYPRPLLSGLSTATVCSGSPFNYTPGSATAGTSFTWTRAVGVGISNAAGSGSGPVNEVLNNVTLASKIVTYRYTLTANGCSNIQNVSVIVDPTPVSPVISVSSPAEVCSHTMYQNFGASVAAPDSVMYTWTATNASVYAEGAGHRYALVTFNTAGNARVILTAVAIGYTCFIRDTFSVTVSTSEAPNADIYYVQDHFFYTDNTVDSYQWGYDDARSIDSTMYNGEINQSYHNVSPDFAGKHYWVMTEKGGCSSKSYYNAPVGIIPVGAAEVVTMTVFPNPSRENVVVELSGINGGNITVELSDIAGRQISSKAVIDNKAQINVNNLSSGVYMVSCYQNGVKVGTTKLVKE